MSNPNLARSLRWIDEVWNGRRLDLIDELLDPAGEARFEGGVARGVAAVKRYYAAFLAAFPDLRMEVEAVMADGDDVAFRWHGEGTHSGDGLGVPSHRRESFRGMTWHRYRAGKLVAIWVHWNQSALFLRLQQAARGCQRGRAGGPSAATAPAGAARYPARGR
jgi:predicted ester cyclase